MQVGFAAYCKTCWFWRRQHSGATYASEITIVVGDGDEHERPPSPSRLEEGDFLLCFGTSGPVRQHAHVSTRGVASAPMLVARLNSCNCARAQSDLQLSPETEGGEGGEGGEEGRLHLLLNGERIARPSAGDMRARVYEAASEASYPCPECGRSAPHCTQGMAQCMAQGMAQGMAQCITWCVPSQGLRQPTEAARAHVRARRRPEPSQSRPGAQPYAVEPATVCGRVGD